MVGNACWGWMPRGQESSAAPQDKLECSAEQRRSTGSRDYEDKRQRGGPKTGKPPWYSDTNLSGWKGKNLKG